MRDYELTVLFAGETGEKELDKGVKALAAHLTSVGAKVVSKRDPELRTMTYEMGKSKQAHYVFMEVSLPVDKIAEIENKIKLTQGVIRYLLVRKE